MRLKLFEVSVAAAPFVIVGSLSDAGQFDA